MSILDTATTHRIQIEHWTVIGEDDRGNEAGNFTDDVDEQVPARMIQRSETEQTAGEQTVIGVWDCYLFPDTRIEDTARITFDGRTFDVTGIVDVHDWDGSRAVRQIVLREVA